MIDEESDTSDSTMIKPKAVHKHPTTPIYYLADDRYANGLEPDTYKPRDLLNLYMIRLPEDLAFNPSPYHPFRWEVEASPRSIVFWAPSSEAEGGR